MTHIFWTFRTACLCQWVSMNLIFHPKLEPFEIIVFTLSIFQSPRRWFLHVHAGYSGAWGRAVRWKRYENSRFWPYQRRYAVPGWAGCFLPPDWHLHGMNREQLIAVLVRSKYSNFVWNFVIHSQEPQYCTGLRLHLNFSSFLRDS